MSENFLRQRIDKCSLKYPSKFPWIANFPSFSIPLVISYNLFSMFFFHISSTGTQHTRTRFTNTSTRVSSFTNTYSHATHIMFRTQSFWPYMAMSFGVSVALSYDRIADSQTQSQVLAQEKKNAHKKLSFYGIVNEFNYFFFLFLLSRFFFSEVILSYMWVWNGSFLCVSGKCEKEEQMIGGRWIIENFEIKEKLCKLYKIVRKKWRFLEYIFARGVFCCWSGCLVNANIILKNKKFP